MRVEALIIVGGDGSMTTALQLQEAGINCIGVPKTIDNDLEATAMTFGFDSAVASVMDALDRLHTTATSHKRVMVLEVMGRHAGWIALHGGIAGGAHVILIPEIPFDYDKICEALQMRETRGSIYSLVVVAEGAKPSARPGGDAAERRAASTGSAESATSSPARSRRAPARKRAAPCSAISNAAARRRRSIASSARASASRRCDLSRERQFGSMVSYQNYQVQPRADRRRRQPPAPRAAGRRDDPDRARRRDLVRRLDAVARRNAQTELARSDAAT